MAKRNAEAKPPSDLDKTEEPIPLSKALDIIKEKYPWMPTWSLRQAVVAGEVESYRSSPKKGAHYYVRLSDLVAALPKTEAASSQ